MYTTCKRFTSVFTTGNDGEFHPLSVWKSRGYSAAQLANIEKYGEKRFDATLKCDTYQLKVYSTSEKDNEMDEHNHQWGPQNPPKKPKTSKAY